MISGKDIRKQFIDFFKDKEHNYIPSSPVVPIDDPTLLFTNAGMNQFKSIFIGQKLPEFLRVVNSQKCIRAGGKHNDLEEVGKDGYHHTFFEMLGNWSFGDYYKKEAIMWAWELLTDVWGLPKNKLYATVHDSDHETYELWLKFTDIAEKNVSYHGDKDNFWEMGDTGPCGPCSEIHIDRGDKYCDKIDVTGHICRVNGNCSRFIELWNLVFIQYNRDENGNLLPLPQKYVDTGAGLDRICQVLQSKKSNYQTDLFLPIIEAISSISQKLYSEDKGFSHRVIADHVRCLSFALADGGFPSNEGRGYVLRRILRRAARHGRLLDLHVPFLYKLVDTVIEIMGHHYHELIEKQEFIKSVIKAEEERFNLTLDKGLEKFSEITSQTKDKIIQGSDAFLLYDTYGFPLDLTTILAEEKGLILDTDGFNKEMEQQKKRARESSNFKYNSNKLDWKDLSEPQKTQFIGYDHFLTETNVISYTLDGENNVRIQLRETPFVAEAGGQISDIGRIYNRELSISINNVKKINDKIVHFGKLEYGVIDNKKVTAEINVDLRKKISRNHTATHLLHKALRLILGEHVQQKGSLVSPEYLRFDFAHYVSMTPKQIIEVEKTINYQIRENNPVSIKITSINEARKTGATALFGEKYDESVRVVSIGEFSNELCGGTHVGATGEIGFFKILSESSSAAGIRRIEAITGDVAEQWVLSMQSQISMISAKLDSTEKKIIEKIENILSEKEYLEKQIYEFKQNLFKDITKELVKKTNVKNGYSVIIDEVSSMSTDDLRKLGDHLLDNASHTVFVVFSKSDEKVNIIVVVTNDLTGIFHAGKLASQISAFIGGKGGGKADTAMAGGKEVDKIDFAIAEAKKMFD